MKLNGLEAQMMMAERGKLGIIGQYLQSDGWHAWGIFQTAEAARQWRNAVDESGGHHHARRTKRVSLDSGAYVAALEAAAVRKEGSK